RSNNLDDFTSGIDDRPADTMNVLDRLVRKDYAELDLGPRLLANASLSGFIKPLQVTRVNSSASLLKGYRAVRRIEPKCSIGFFRPISDFPVNGVMRKATNMT